MGVDVVRLLVVAGAGALLLVLIVLGVILLATRDKSRWDGKG
jgi:hypothetical protein